MAAAMIVTFPGVKDASAPSPVRVHTQSRPARPAMAARPARTRGWRRFLPGAATLVAVCAVWFGASALAGAGGQGGQSTVASASAGSVYVVKPGDTLLSIALRLDPSGDPRQVVALLAADLHGAPLRAGDHLALP
jgi:Tfp pilus assembly protein FimV